MTDIIPGEIIAPLVVALVTWAASALPLKNERLVFGLRVAVLVCVALALGVWVYFLYFPAPGEVGVAGPAPAAPPRVVVSPAPPPSDRPTTPATRAKPTTPSTEGPMFAVRVVHAREVRGASFVVDGQQARVTDQTFNLTTLRVARGAHVLTVKLGERSCTARFEAPREEPLTLLCDGTDR